MAGPTAPGEANVARGDARRGPFHGIRTVVRTAAGAAATLPPGAAVALLAAACLSTALGAPLPATVTLVAFAVGASAPPGSRARGCAHVVATAVLWLAVLWVLQITDFDVRESRSLSWAAAVIGSVALLLGLAFSRRLRPRSDDPFAVGDARTAFLAACQRHPWACTLLVGLVAGVDAVIGGADGEHARAVWWLLPVVAVAIPAALTARSRDLVGFLAPLALGVPLAVAGSLGAMARMARRAPPTEAQAAIVILTLWILALSHAVARRHRHERAHRALAWTWVVLVVCVQAFALSPRSWQTVYPAGGLALIVAAPFVLSAAAEFSARPTLAIAVACGGAAVAGTVVWFGGGNLSHEVLRSAFDSAVRRFDAPPLPPLGVAGILMRHAEIAALVVGAGAILRRARALTAIPADHPVFTEAPYVPRPTWAPPGP